MFRTAQEVVKNEYVKKVKLEENMKLEYEGIKQEDVEIKYEKYEEVKMKIDYGEIKQEELIIENDPANENYEEEKSDDSGSTFCQIKEESSKDEDDCSPATKLDSLQVRQRAEKKGNIFVVELNNY